MVLKVTEVLEQVLVVEDQIFLRLARTAAPTSNDLFFFSTFTPSVFSEMKSQVGRWGIPVTSALIAFDIWNDITADTEFSSWFNTGESLLNQATFMTDHEDKINWVNSVNILEQDNTEPSLAGNSFEGVTTQEE